MNEVPTRRLIDWIASGDAQALEDLYDRFGGAIRAFVLTLLRDPDQTDHCVVAIFTEIWRIAPQFRADKTTSEQWMRRIASVQVAVARGSGGQK